MCVQRALFTLWPGVAWNYIRISNGSLLLFDNDDKQAAPNIEYVDSPSSLSFGLLLVEFEIDSLPLQFTY